MKPRTVAIFSMISAKVVRFFRWSMATTCLIALARRGGFLCLGGLFALARVLGGGAPLAACASFFSLSYSFRLH
jgi:hypothetical protein